MMMGNRDRLQTAIYSNSSVVLQWPAVIVVVKNIGLS